MSTYVKWSELAPARTRAGECLVWQFQVKDRSGAVVNITGWTFGLWAQDKLDASNVIEVGDADFEITDAANGKVECTMARALTLNQGGKTFAAECWRVNTGFDDEIAAGDWIVEATVRQ